ncbi:3-oxoacyl-[acyl-carrier-protein] synthase II, chloroplastic isoform X1 [Durio zibethinus]|uniref:beta-ketoacyl-[acyl-carrier-protein] synthase I n=2 Tax=Durio zibethinus TaxID=66656 RepID=A0A6P5ZPR4_DURZI|nr:3-oxoacyl-[acyl-carrier-protein] synthase II, chloroplastic isoform X1 [Durio zibethinus]XP_022754770.1 3-oxoacyl-[acyl-carrier-protein] synthase II, chloroplastic isoform X1 [Durio zibethinus]XP_022754771.1 3-oxoacyl-[acyl-carrier-protein] synthase II, chloroplastic isoform X1 [Durio zibethinus]
MASSSLASPLCTWLVAACVSVTCGKDQSPSAMLHSSASASSKRLGRCARNRRKALLPQCCGGSTGKGDWGLISSFCGSSIQGLVTSCLAFEPCNDYYSSKSRSLFGQSGSLSSLFGSKNVPFNNNRKHRRLNRGAVHSGEVMAIAVQPTREIATKKKPPTKQRRVVVTGMGVVTPLGHDPDVFYNNLLEGASGISEIETFDCAQFPTRIAGEIKSFSTDGWVAPKLSKRMDKFMLYSLTAGKKALQDGGVTGDVMEELDKAKCGVLVGSAMGGMKVFNDAIEALRISYRKMNPFCVPFATTNMGSAMLAMDLGWMGPNYSISTACATSNFCILNAANHIIRGEADVMLCGGSDAAIIPIGLGGFVACRALSQRNNDPTKASRPWDVSRDGFVMGEGAGVLLLEELEHAKRRGATIYAEFLGGSFTCDAYHMTEPHPDGAGIILCIEKALAQSGVSRGDVNYINAHATSTPAGDIKEYQALLHCFGKNPELRVNSTKSMIGHLLGAAGAVEAVAAVQAIRTGWVHPNINLENPDEGVDTNVLVGPEKERLNVKAALSNSFGFGGHNSSIIFAPYK